MANSEPHPLDPDSPLNDYERVVYRALWGEEDDSDDEYVWRTAAEASNVVTLLKTVGAHVCVGRDCPHESHWTIDLEPLPSEARARSGDPQTSKIAAASITEADMAERHRAVLQVARTFADAWTYDELVHRYGIRRSYGGRFVEDLPQMEPQSIRSRCAELRRAGWIEEAGRALSDAGRACSTWRVIR